MVETIKSYKDLVAWQRGIKFRLRYTVSPRLSHGSRHTALQIRFVVPRFRWHRTLPRVMPVARMLPCEVI